MSDDDCVPAAITPLPALPELDWRPAQLAFWQLEDELVRVWADLQAWAAENGFDLQELLDASTESAAHPRHRRRQRPIRSMRLRVAWLRAHRSVLTRRERGERV